MNDLFNRCIEVILRNEGGYVNHRNDPGGETNFGIAKKFFPDEDIKNLTVERAKEIYFERYWLPMHLDGIINEESVLQIFDFGVNAGRSRAIKLAQEIVGIEKDGLCGQKTRDAINNFKYDFLSEYKELRKEYYYNLAYKKSAMKVFLKGWLNRVDKTHF